MLRGWLEVDCQTVYKGEFIKQINRIQEIKSRMLKNRALLKTF